LCAASLTGLKNIFFVERILIITVSICCSCNICPSNGVVPAISKHVIPQDPLAGGDKGIGVDESAALRIIVTALEIVQP
jgi:hypothetical protein